MTRPQVLVAPDADVLAAAAAARLITRLVDAQAARGDASVVLTGGSIGIALLHAVAQSAARAAVSWDRVDVWWGDERFVPGDDAERNERQAREALLDHVPVDPGRVHPMPPSDGEFGDDAAAAAQSYADELLTAGGGQVPAFDVLLLGMGPDGHTASIFPGRPGTRETRIAFEVHDSPKPPPTRISLSFDAIHSAREVWMVVAGSAKAEMTARALSGADRTEVPAAGVEGRERTLWLLDAPAASAVRHVS